MYKTLFFTYRVEDVKWYLKDGILYHLLPMPFGLEITTYDSKTGEKLKVKKASAAFITTDAKLVKYKIFYYLRGYLVLSTIRISKRNSKFSLVQLSCLMHIYKRKWYKKPLSGKSIKQWIYKVCKKNED